MENPNSIENAVVKPPLAQLNKTFETPRIETLINKVKNQETLTDEEAAELDLFEHDRDTHDHGVIAYDCLVKKMPDVIWKADEIDRREGSGSSDSLRAGISMVGELPEDQMSEIYDRYPSATKNRDGLDHQHIHVFSGGTIERGNSSIDTPNDYLKIMIKFALESIEAAKSTEFAPESEVKKNIGRSYALDMDAPGSDNRHTTADNWMLHSSSGGWRETHIQNIKDVITNLRGFMEAAGVTGDSNTENLVGEQLDDVERQVAELSKQ